ncbi:uncharacterized protein LOC103041463 [Astyanax mexicanus]|uniref:uncharacterized protein LOC103041463 n=1 Tax=Astyanax mexicanus TaxID=7994 RepID=UPI0020CB1E9C|nr:uncharacterized protein LOC103041463 [Astyanax mexicanus]
MKIKEKTCRKRRESYDWNSGWNSSLKEIGYLLPISGTGSGKGLTRKETLIHMLQYFGFLQSQIQILQSSLPAHCLPDVTEREESESESEDTPNSEPSTPPHLLKAKRKYNFTRSRKKPTSNQEPCDDRDPSRRQDDLDRNFTVSKNQENPPTCRAEKSLCFIEDSNSNTQIDSSDSTYSLKTLPPTASSSRTGSSVDQESPCQGLGSCCSVCEERTGSEDGSLGSKDLDTPPSGSFILKDRMLITIPNLGNGELPASPTLPQMPVLPLFSRLGTGEGLNLSPSLLTSPARGLSHPLLPTRNQELQTLFEDVWVTPKPTVLKASSGASKPPDNVHCRQCGSRGCVSSPCDEDDMRLTPKQCIPKKTASQIFDKKFYSKSQKVINSGLKKKCVNGFIMFCRMNRRIYLRTHPGTPSTVVTKELAKLWHIMPKQERRLYCLKARRYSRQHNRNVCSEGQEAEREAEKCVPSPLHLLLAHRDLYFASRGKS